MLDKIPSLTLRFELLTSPLGLSSIDSACIALALAHIVCFSLTMGVELAIWRWRVGCYSHGRPRKSPGSRTLQLAGLRPVMQCLLLLLVLGSVTTAEPHHCTDVPVTAFVSGFMTPANVTSMMPPGGNQPAALTTGITDSAVAFSVFADSRHSILLCNTLLIRSGVERNPGPPKTRQQRLDAAGNLIMDHDNQPAANFTLADIMAELRGMRTELRDDINQVKTDVTQNTADINKVNDRQGALERENKVLQDKISQLQDQNRRNNLIVGGLPEENKAEPETWEETEEKVRQSLVTDLHLDQQVVDRLTIDRAQRVGKRGGNNNSRLIKVNFISSKDKQTVLNKAREVKPDKPYFREDFSPAVLESRSKLKPGLLAAREKHYQAFLAHDKLVIQQEGKKNVYAYNTDEKVVKAVSRNFEDNIQWAPGVLR